MLNIIDRYIIRLFLGFFIGSLVVVASMFVAIDAMTAMLKFNAPFGTLALYYGYALPQVLYQMFPVACLIATVFTLSGMNKANELTALFSMGTSLARVSAPILSVVISISLFSLAMSDWILPALNQKKNYVFYVDIQNQPGLYSTVKTNKIWYRARNIILNIKTLSADEGTAQGLTLYYFDDAWNLVQSITADRLKINGSNWRLTKGTLTLFADESSFPMTQTFEQKDLQMEPDTFDLRQSTSGSEVMSFGQLKTFIRKNKDAGLDTLRYEVDYHSKFSFAFAAFVMALIGIPFCVRHARQGGIAANMGVVILLVFTYWTIYSSSLTLGQHGTLPPVLAAWAPNLLFIGISGALILRSKK